MIECGDFGLASGAKVMPTRYDTVCIQSEQGVMIEGMDGNGTRE